MNDVLIYYNNDDMLSIIDKLNYIYKINNYTIVQTGERAIAKEYNNVEIINDIQLIKNRNFECAFVISESPFVNKMYFELYNIGIKKVYTLNAEYLSILDDNDSIEPLITCFDLDEKPLIGYLETHLFNKCNLNCKGCTHFSNIDDTDFLDLDEYEEIISKLSYLYNINTFRLMGGEPLMNKKLADYIEITRKYFPNSNIDIATNGLLICNMSKNLINVIKQNRIIIKISLYLPIAKIQKKINDFLRNHKLLYFYGNGCKQVDDKVLIREFHKCLTLKKQYDSKFNANNCFARECWFLRKNLISKCATPLQIDILNRKFNTNFSVSENDYIDIFKIEKSSWDDVARLLQPMDFCSYCSPEEKKYNWEIKNIGQELSDYVIEEGEI